eukprot:TRINITY_DN74479_c0_g1_i1.p1 TRINITY_DN74479_c0_g1~~TRINITY_DN74479_c0_g1_i1.p1  ORF type:complete len:392 (-),score=134.34 TRINITY_DN74479_c0_g1_i1:309-1484(-)
MQQPPPPSVQVPGVPPGPPSAQQQQQNQMAALMWQMQMAQQPGMMPGMPMLPGGWPGAAPTPPMMSPILHVRVEGLKFEYQLTDDDVRKVFARYGEVRHVSVDRDGTAATVQLEQPHQAMAAQHDLDHKQLSGMSGAFLRVEFASPPQAPYPSSVDPGSMAAAAAMAQSFPQAMMPGMPGMAPPMMPPSQQSAGQPKKHTCKLEVGIENEGEFRVGSRVIQIARQIWQDQDFQRHGGKTRLRGKGIGGPHEADEPLALCISCSDQGAFDKAVKHAEMQLQKVHNDYRTFCQQNGKPIPDLSVKVSKKGIRDSPQMNSGDIPKGERPPNAPADDEIERLIEERNEARKAQNFQKADQVRDYLKQRGVVLMDEKAAKGNLQGKEVTKWRFWRP